MAMRPLLLSIVVQTRTKARQCCFYRLLPPCIHYHQVPSLIAFLFFVVARWRGGAKQSVLYSSCLIRLGSIADRKTEE